MIHSSVHLPASRVPKLRSAEAPRLKVIEEAPVWDAAPRGEDLKPMPFLPVSGAMPTTAKRPQEQDPLDDPFEGRDEPWAEADFSARQSLPRFVPLQPELYAISRDPWSIQSVLDMLRIYLPEISLSTGLVAVSGVLGGRLFSKFSGGSDMLTVLAGYLVVHFLVLALVYGSAKRESSAPTRARMRNILLGCFLMIGTHLLANGLLMAGR